MPSLMKLLMISGIIILKKYFYFFHGLGAIVRVILYVFYQKTPFFHIYCVHICSFYYCLLLCIFHFSLGENLNPRNFARLNFNFNQIILKCHHCLTILFCVLFLNSLISFELYAHDFYY
jgi:hypothetical protein